MTDTNKKTPIEPMAIVLPLTRDGKIVLASTKLNPHPRVAAGAPEADELLGNTALRVAKEQCGVILMETSRAISVCYLTQGHVKHHFFILTDVERRPDTQAGAWLTVDVFYKLVLNGELGGYPDAEAILRAQVYGYIQPPREIPLAAQTVVESVSHNWDIHSLSLQLMSDGNIVVSDTVEDWCSMPPMVRGVLMTDLRPIVNRLKRKSRRKRGGWTFEFRLMYGHTYDWSTDDHRRSGPLHACNYHVGESDVRELAQKFEKILKARKELGRTGYHEYVY